MRAITINEPWATLIVHGIKRVENRSWSTNYRGSLLIHAGKAIDTDGLEFCKAEGILVPELRPGKIVGRVNLIGIHAIDEPCCRDYDSRFATGPFCWFFAEAEILPEAVFCVGQQKLWTLPEYLMTELRFT
jgi:hypothetical protein